MTDIAVEVPAGWESRRDPHPGISLLLLAPATGSAFRANAVITLDHLDASTDLRAWQYGTDLRLPTSLTDYQLLDLELVDIAGAPGVRRLAHHTAPGGKAVTMEQWAVVVGREGYTLTATVPTLSYLEYREAVRAMATTWQISSVR